MTKPKMTAYKAVNAVSRAIRDVLNEAGDEARQLRMPEAAWVEIVLAALDVMAEGYRMRKQEIEAEGKR